MTYLVSFEDNVEKARNQLALARENKLNKGEWIPEKDRTEEIYPISIGMAEARTSDSYDTDEDFSESPIVVNEGLNKRLEEKLNEAGVNLYNVNEVAEYCANLDNPMEAGETYLAFIREENEDTA